MKFYMKLLMICGLLFCTNAFGMIVCNQPYALCDTSPCVPVPGIKGKAVCFCSIFSGYSVGNLSCQKRAPFIDKHSLQHYYSNYGLNNIKLHKLMTCPKYGAWTFCLDKQCIVDPRNPNNAICTCDIVNSKNYITFGGNCDTSTCSNTLYSAATKSDIDQGNSLLIKVLNLSKAPLLYCPVKK